jgi:hypothetical protein
MAALSVPIGDPATDELPIEMNERIGVLSSLARDVPALATTPTDIPVFLRRETSSPRAASASMTSKTMAARSIFGNPTVTRGSAATVFGGKVIVLTAE